MGRRLAFRFPDSPVGLAFASGALILLGLDLARRKFRHSLMFCPDPAPLISWSPADHGLPAERVLDLHFSGPQGERLHGWYCQAERPIASALYCHGNSGNLTYSAAVIPHLLSAGISVFLFDYRGFGKSEGVPSLSGIVEDARSAAREHDRLRPGHVPSIVYGYSLGGAVAARLAGQHRFDGLVLQSTFTNVREMARFRSGRFPLHLISGNFFDTALTLSRLDTPVMVIHGTEDEVIPVGMAHRLVSSCRVAPDVHLIGGGEHKNLYQRDGAAILQRLRTFVSNLKVRTESKDTRENPGAFKRVRRLFADFRAGLAGNPTMRTG